MRKDQVKDPRLDKRGKESFETRPLLHQFGACLAAVQTAGQATHGRYRTGAKAIVFQSSRHAGWD